MGAERTRGRPVGAGAVRDDKHRGDPGAGQLQAERQTLLGVAAEDDDRARMRRAVALRKDEEIDGQSHPGNERKGEYFQHEPQHGGIFANRRLARAGTLTQKMPTCLFTCAGQRVDVVEAFGKAGAVTLATDVSPYAPTLYRADRFAVVPRYTDPGYIGALAELVRGHDVDLIVPLTDLDHRVLAAAKPALEPALVLLPDSDVIERTADKYASHLFFLENGIVSPDTWLPEEPPAEIDYPVLVKAREGFGSNHIYRASNDEELDFFLRYTTVPSMVQRACRGKEFSIDIFCDLDSRCLNAIPRTMIHSKGGESIKGMTLRDPELIELGRRVGETLGLRGPATVQCFREPDGRLEITDVNPRFGGAFALPTAAGSHYPELALALAAGEKPEPRLGEFEDGVVMTRFFSQIVLQKGEGDSLLPLESRLAAENEN